MNELASNKEPAFSARRFQILGACFSIVFIVLCARLYVLQVVEGKAYLQKSRENFVQQRRITHSRGFIYDQDKRVLVDNRPSHNLYLTRAFLPDSAKAIRRLAGPLGLSSDAQKDLDIRVLKNVEKGESEIIEVRAKADAGTCASVLDVAKRFDIPGVLVSWFSENNSDGCRITIDPKRFASMRAVLERIRALAGLDDKTFDDAVQDMTKRARVTGAFQPIALLRDLDFDAYARLRNETAMGELPGVHLADGQRRDYLKGTLASHLIGFMNELSRKEYQSKREDGYRLGDLVGRRGVEQAFEDTLRGEDGVLQVVVDAKGRAQNESVSRALLGDDTLKKQEPQPGKSVLLTLDAEMQRVAEESFRGRAGSVVALEAHTGFVLALASIPSYDPNLVTGPRAAQVRRELNENEYRPWRNKAIQDHYSPGSTFKAITAVAALQNDFVDEHTHKNCPGYFKLGRMRWRCYNRSGHGPIALVKALQFSCDTYFYSLGHQMGADLHAKSARLFGFGSRTGIGIDREIPGIMPDVAYYKERFGSYRPGFVINNSIGQGDVNVTPLQLAVAYGAIANGGTVYQPQAVLKIVDEQGHAVQEAQPIIKSDLTGERKTLKLVRQALSHVTEPGGTAYGVIWRKDQPKVSEWLQTSGVKIGGKTGTAQVVRLSKNVDHVDPEDVEYWQRDHAWFVGLIPAENPEIVVVTMTEHGGFGGSTSAPVVAAVAQAYWEGVRGKGKRYELVDGRPAYIQKRVELGDILLDDDVPATPWNPRKYARQRAAAKAAEAAEAAEAAAGVGGEQ